MSIIINPVDEVKIVELNVYVEIGVHTDKVNSYQRPSGLQNYLKHIVFRISQELNNLGSLRIGNVNISDSDFTPINKFGYSGTNNKGCTPRTKVFRYFGLTLYAIVDKDNMMNDYSVFGTYWFQMDKHTRVAIVLCGLFKDRPSKNTMKFLKKEKI